MSIVIHWNVPAQFRLDSGEVDFSALEIDMQFEVISVFGQVYVDGIENSQFEKWEPILNRWASACELDLKVHDLGIETAVRWLNLGIRSLVITEQEFQTWSMELPTNRLSIQREAGGYAQFGNNQTGGNHTLVRPLGDSPEARLAIKESWLIDAGVLAETPADVAGIFWDSLGSDRPDGLVPTLVVDPLGIALGLVYSNRESLSLALEKRTGVYWSRSRNALWEKGATSGNRQRLRQIEMDCDRDALRFTVEQLAEGFCHTGSYGCFGDDRSLSMIERHLASRLNGNDRQSVTWQLANHPERLREKLIEEVDELLTSTDPENADWEFADILYFALIALKSRGGNVEGALQELGRRSRRVTRRKAKGEIC